METLQYVIGVTESKNSRLPSPLCSQGFNSEDAQNLSYISDIKDFGENVSVMSALVSFFLLRKNYFSPIRSQRKLKDLLAMIGIPPLLYIGIEYYNHQQRIGPNSYFGNIISNNIYSVNAMQLTHNFYKFNRKFTEEEIQQMKFNEKLKTRGPKKYHYNPHVHGDEQKHKEQHTAWNTGRQYLPRELVDKIEQENMKKIQNGEQLRLHPVNLSHKLDRKGKEIYNLSFHART